MEKGVSLKEAERCDILTIQEKSIDVDGAFLVCSLLEDRISRGEQIVFIVHHHGFGHYLGVGTKLGINLQKLKEAGKLEIIDVMDKIGLLTMRSESEVDLSKLLGEVFQEVRSHVMTHSDKNGVTCVVDHPGDVALAFNDLPIILNYVTYLQSLAVTNSSIIYVTGPSTLQLEPLNACLTHYADVTIILRGLAMGGAADISGAMEIKHKKMERELAKAQNDYHFQLMDKKVRLFAPGTVQFR